MTLFENIHQQNKRPRLQFASDSSNKEEITEDAKRETNMDNPSTPNTAPSSLAVLAEVANPIHPKVPYLNLISEQNGGADCPCEDNEEMPPLKVMMPQNCEF